MLIPKADFYRTIKTTTNNKPPPNKPDCVLGFARPLLQGKIFSGTLGLMSGVTIWPNESAAQLEEGFPRSRSLVPWLAGWLGGLMPPLRFSHDCKECHLHTQRQVDGAIDCGAGCRLHALLCVPSWESLAAG